MSECGVVGNSDAILALELCYSRPTSFEIRLLNLAGALLLGGALIVVGYDVWASHCRAIRCVRYA